MRLMGRHFIRLRPNILVKCSVMNLGCILYIIPDELFFFFSFKFLKKHLQSGGHDNRVNCIQWHQDNGCLYSCSDDKHIVEWNTQTCKVKW